MTGTDGGSTQVAIPRGHGAAHRRQDLVGRCRIVRRIAQGLERRGLPDHGRVVDVVTRTPLRLTIALTPDGAPAGG